MKPQFGVFSLALVVAWGLIAGLFAVLAWLQLNPYLAGRLAPDLPHDSVDALSALLGFAGLLVGAIGMLLARVAARIEARADERVQFEALGRAMDTVGEGLVVFDHKDRLVTFNETYRTLYPRSPGLLQPGTSYDAIMQDGLALGVFRFEGDGQQWLTDNLAIHRQDDRWVELEKAAGGWIRARDIRLKSGVMLGLRQDITDLKTRQQELEQSIAVIETNLTNLPYAIAVYDEEERLLFWNQPYLTMFGLAHEDVFKGAERLDIVRKLAELGEFGEGDPEELTNRQLEFLRRPPGSSVVRRRSNGRWVEIRSSPMPTGGRVVAFLDITDITTAQQRLRDSENRFRALSESTREAVLLYTNDRIIEANSAAEKLFGYAGPALQQLDPSVLLADADDRDILTIRPSAGETSGRMSFVRQDGSRFIGEVSFRSIPFAGMLAGVVSIRDITERERAEALLREARDAAERAAATKAAFLAMMSHEIRTPLNGVLGMIGLVIDSGLSGEPLRFARTARDSGEALLTIINDVLDFSRLEAGKLPLESLRFDMVQLIDSSLDLQAYAAANKGLELVSVIEGDVPVSLRGDLGRLRQVLLNLISNAVKFTERGSIHLRVSLSQREETRMIRFEVSDTGIGIKPEVQPMLFSEFTQADATLTRRFGGTGLGLAICRRLVELMAGAIGVTSAEGKGSQFWVELPLHDAGEATHATALLEANILICLPALPVTAGALADQFRAWGAKVTRLEAPGEAGEFALDRLRDGAPFHACLLDADGMQAVGAIMRAAAVKRRLLVTSVLAAGEEGPPDHAATRTILSPIRPGSLPGAILGRLEDADQDVDAAPSPADPGQAASLIARRRRARLLLAEDSPTNQMVAAAILRRAGLEVDIVGDGRQAVDAVRQRRYDLILMDISMPELDGLEATQQIRALEDGAARVPIIALTANAMAGDRERFLAAGLDDYLSKPVDRDAMLEAIDRMLPDGLTDPQAAADGPDAAALPMLDDQVIDQLRGEVGDAVLTELIEVFVNEARNRVAAMQAALAEGTVDRIEFEAHALKGSGGSFGARQLSALAASLEQRARGEPAAALTDAVAAIDVALAGLIDSYGACGLIEIRPAA